MSEKEKVFCTGRGCRIADRCSRFTENMGEGRTINPPTRVNCLTKSPQPINGCELFLPSSDGFSKVIENDIGND